MELSAAVVATRLGKISQGELSLLINQSFFWTDSTCILRYFENQDKQFQTFVLNRVAAIHDASSQWRYVNTQLNPSDYASSHQTLYNAGYRVQNSFLSQVMHG